MQVYMDLYYRKVRSSKMNVRKSSGTIGLLIEIMLSTLFFSIICVIVLQLFIHARGLEQSSRDKSEAMALAQSLGSMFLSQQDLDELLYGSYGNTLIRGESGFNINLTDDLTPTAQADSAATAEIEVSIINSSDAGTLHRADISIEKHDTILFELSVYKYDSNAES